jgi:hypothetical protein
MTARAGALSIGLRAAALSLNSRSRTGAIRFGILVAGTSPAWAGRAGNRPKVDWLPPAHISWFDPQTGRPNPVFFQFIREIAEVRLGGVNGTTVPQVQTTVAQTQAEVVATQSYATAVGTYAQGVAATATATAQVAQSNSLTGAGSIPPAPEPPDPNAGR